VVDDGGRNPFLAPAAGDGLRNPFKASTEGGSPRKGFSEIKKTGRPFQSEEKRRAFSKQREGLTNID
jgi:hypothetical protein